MILIGDSLIPYDNICKIENISDISTTEAN